MSANVGEVIILLSYLSTVTLTSYRAGKRLQIKYGFTPFGAYTIAALQFLLLSFVAGIVFLSLFYWIKREEILLFCGTIVFTIFLFILLKTVRPSAYWDWDIWFSKELKD